MHRANRPAPSTALAVAGLLLLPALAACAHAAPLPAKAMELNRDGAAAMAAGDLQTAEARVALAIEYNPRFTEAWVNLGLIEMSRGNFERAAHDLVKARDLNPDLPTPHHALGLLADAEQRGADAEAHYRAALRVDPGFSPARVNLARRLFERGAVEEAREQFLRATQVAPDVADGWAGLCETLLRLGRADEARDVLRGARARFGTHPIVELLEARFLLRRSAFVEAEDRLAPLTRSPDRRYASAALSWLAVARLGEGDVAGATEAARRAVALDPDDTVARYALQSAGATDTGPANTRYRSANAP
jgi:tetratricopeptide (TPR) repeat protein